MLIAGMYSFNQGMEAIRERHPDLLQEVEAIIATIGSKVPSHDQHPGHDDGLFSPASITAAFEQQFVARGWTSNRVKCELPISYYTPDFAQRAPLQEATRDVDFVKARLGIEIQFTESTFSATNACAKLTIFKNLGVIDTGIEIVPVKQLADDMSSGVSYFEQFVWDLEARGVADIDIPVLILGIDS